MVHAHMYSTYTQYMYIIVHATCTLQCVFFPLVNNFVLFVVEYHPVSVAPFVAVISDMPPSNALLKSRLVKTPDRCSFFASRKEFSVSMEKVESV